MKKPFKLYLHLESRHAKTKSNIPNFHRNNSAACCLVTKTVLAAFLGHIKSIIYKTLSSGRTKRKKENSVYMEINKKAS